MHAPLLKNPAAPAPSADRRAEGRAGASRKPLQAALRDAPHVARLETQAQLLNAGARNASAGGRGGGRAVVQAYSIEREPKLGSLYSVSDDRQVVTGMGTPNHDLYVDDGSKIGAIRSAAKQGMLTFSDGGGEQLFGRPYRRVQAGFKKVQFEGPKKGVLGKTERRVDLDRTYHEKVAPAIAEQSQEKYAAAVNRIKGLNWAKRYHEIKAMLANLTRSVELFKKLVIANQAREGYHDVVNAMDAPHDLVQAIEGAIYSNAATSETVNAARDAAQAPAIQIEADFAGDVEIVATAAELLDLAARLASLLPDETDPVDLMAVHSISYQESLIQSMNRKDPMFYRACDVMASTVMGNTVTNENKDQLKIYAAGGTSGAFHYAARILTAGRDWITLESFAASAREREILGITQANAATNVEHSWQYMMYGSIGRGIDAVDDQDKAFELYTKLRYFLKGIKEPGEFRRDQRNRLTGQIPEDAFTAIGNFDEERSRQIWDRLARSGVFSDDGEVADPRHLDRDYISLRLAERDRPFASAISDRLNQLHATPRSRQRQVQQPDNSDFKNVAAWIKLMRLPVDTAQLGVELGNELASYRDPNLVHNKGWMRMMLGMEKK